MLVDDVHWEIAAEPLTADVFHQVDQERTLDLTYCPLCGGPREDDRGPECRYDTASYLRGQIDLNCPCCLGVGYVDVPTSDFHLMQTRPGSDERVAIFAARYRAGLTVFPETRREALQWT